MMRPEEDRRQLYLIVGIIFSIFLILVALTIASQRTSFFGRASAPGGVVVPPLLSYQNSYVFASPIAASADGESIIRVTVFLLNNQGLGVSGQSVNLKVQPEANISPVLPVTDNLGRATFDLTSNTPGDYTISAEVEDGSLPQTVSVSFR